MSDLDAAACVVVALLTNPKKRKKRIWMKEWLKKKSDFTHERLLNELRTSEPSDFKNFLILDSVSFDELLRLVEIHIKKVDTTMRDAISMKPTEFKPLDDDLSEELRASCRPGLMPMAGVLVSPPGTAMPEEFKLYAERLRNFEVRPDDTWVISYPKCGTTWTQEMVWLIGNNCDFDAASEKLLLQRFPFLEAVSIIPQPKIDEQAQFLDEHVLFADTIQFVEEQPSPRFIKSHLPVELLPRQIWTKKPKIIYVTRNPMDAAISYYHHHRLWNGYVGSYETFMEGFLNDKLVYSPFWNHVLEYKKLENQEHVLIISFEEMKRDLKTIIQQTTDFLGKTLTAEQIVELSEHLSFSNMKNNPAINGEDFIKEVKEKHDMPEDDPELTFIRKGQVGGWKKELPHHFVEKFKSWTKEKLRGTTYTEEDFYLTQ